MRILGIGLSGLVGSRIAELLSPKHSFVNFSLENGVDITNREDIIARITSDTASSWVLHLAAYTNVQAAEADRGLGVESMAWKVNVVATEHIVEACVASGKRLLYVDTDYAFDGTKQTYTEEDVIHPLSWYAMTKSEGAKRVLGLGDKGLVIRISNPYRAHPIGKKDFAHKMLERLLAGTEVIAPADQLFVPTFIDDIANAVDALLAHSANGIYHVVGDQAVSPYDVAKTIARVYACDPTLVKKTTFVTFFASRAPIPQYAVLQNEKIRSLGVVMRGFDEGIAEVKRLEDADL